MKHYSTEESKSIWIFICFIAFGTALVAAAGYYLVKLYS